MNEVMVANPSVPKEKEILKKNVNHPALVVREKDKEQQRA